MGGADRKAGTPDPRGAIRARARALGFDAVGFTAPDPGSDAASRFQRFLDQGGHGDMGWLERRADWRASPPAMWPDVRTVISLGLSYAPAGDPLAGLDRPSSGNISVYARGRDYHLVMKKQLRVLARWIAENFETEVKLFVDTAPVLEKPLAARAGLGWQGKHTNLVSRDHGSWLFLGEIYTALTVPHDAPAADRCGTCQSCQDICPTDAFPAPYRLDARRCISYLTIEHAGHIPAEFRPAIGNRIYGCDDCLAVCPWNKFAATSREIALHPSDALIAPSLATLAALDDAAFRALFSGSAVKRLGRDRFVRNVLIAIGNSGDAALIPSAERLLTDPSALVRAMAVWALSRLADGARFAHLRGAHEAAETDAGVRAEWAGAAGGD